MVYRQSPIDGVVVLVFAVKKKKLSPHGESKKKKKRGTLTLAEMAFRMWGKKKRKKNAEFPTQRGVKETLG